MGKKEEVRDEAGNGKGRPGKALSSCHPASLQGMLGSAKRTEQWGVGTPSAAQSPPVLKIQKRGLDMTVPAKHIGTIFSHMGVAEKINHGRVINA